MTKKPRADSGKEICYKNNARVCCKSSQSASLRH